MKFVIATIVAATATTAWADNGFMTSINTETTPRGGSYTTRGGCTAYRAPEVDQWVIQGASALRVLESIYIHQVAAKIEAEGECSCETRYPEWDAAVAELNSRYVNLPDDESSSWITDFANSDRSRLTREVNKVCKAQGVN